jgi:hypothetical protein
MVYVVQSISPSMSHANTYVHRREFSAVFSSLHDNENYFRLGTQPAT